MSSRRFTISPPTTSLPVVTAIYALGASFRTGPVYSAFGVFPPPLPIVGWHRGTPDLYDLKVTGSGPAGWPTHGAPHVVAAIVTLLAAAAPPVGLIVVLLATADWSGVHRGEPSATPKTISGFVA
jgi:hypothetical protein